MNIEQNLKLKLQKAFSKLGKNINLSDIVIEHSRDVSHGDYATNIAMKNCRLFNKSPRDIANDIIQNIDMEGIENIEIAGPGFINFFIKNDSLQAIVKKIIEDGDNFGKGEKKNFKINVEFVSANPTGDLHVGHARGAAIGDSICRILSFAGYDVTREYYINDAGSQILHLAESIEARYKEQLGLPFEMPQDGYYGEDVKTIATTILNEDGKDVLKMSDPISFFRERGTFLELEKIKKDLKDFGVAFDVFSSELKIRSNEAVEKEIEFLKPHIYQDGKALVLKTSDYLDDKDRVIQKSNGDYTYFIPDVVYHVNKKSRGFDLLIDVLGADHHGYINRMKSALMMHGYSADTLEVELIQMVRIIKDGQEMKASKRTGNAITLRELFEEVGVDSTRYLFAMRAASGHLDFDMDLAVEQSSNNPVYYAQYAHARLCSILEQGHNIAFDIEASQLEKESEMALLKHLVSFPSAVLEAAKERAPYKITNYIHDLAECIHHFYTECRVIDTEHL
ncbi:MAG: arginine--tRNA ligase, partial [Bacilli bacterium]